MLENKEIMNFWLNYFFKVFIKCTKEVVNGTKIILWFSEIQSQKSQNVSD